MIHTTTKNLLLSGILLGLFSASVNFGMDEKSQSENQLTFYVQPKTNNTNIVYKLKKNGTYHPFKNYTSCSVKNPDLLSEALKYNAIYRAEIECISFVCDFCNTYNISNDLITNQTELLKNIQSLQKRDFHIFVSDKTNSSHLHLINKIMESFDLPLYIKNRLHLHQIVKNNNGFDINLIASEFTAIENNGESCQVFPNKPGLPNTLDLNNKINVPLSKIPTDLTEYIGNLRITHDIDYFFTPNPHNKYFLRPICFTDDQYQANDDSQQPNIQMKSDTKTTSENNNTIDQKANNSTSSYFTPRNIYFGIGGIGILAALIYCAYKNNISSIKISELFKNLSLSRTTT